jgi:hypothetical protein
VANIKVKEKSIEADSGNKVIIDDEFKKALIKASSDSDADAQDSTKFTLLENLHSKLASIFYTEFTKYDQVEQANRLKMWARLMPTVFGDSEGVKQCQEIVYEHLYDHYQHMASHKRKRESALVYAVKQDTGLIQADKQVASFLGGKR